MRQKLLFSQRMTAEQLRDAARSYMNYSDRATFLENYPKKYHNTISNMAIEFMEGGKK